MVHATLLLAGQLFFVEAQPALEVGEEPATGRALGIEVGAGGSWRGSLPRFFLVGRYEHAAIVHSVFASRQSYESLRTYDDIAAGVRLLFPIYGPFRVYGDLLGGGTVARAELSRVDLPTLESQRFRPAVQLALGLQVRLHDHFSIGLRFQQTWLDDVPDALAAAVSQRLDASRSTYAIALGVHF